ncbi:S-adenosyl-L-methionine-dependent methyltransferases superfamily protein [Tanacetum coccineum]
MCWSSGWARSGGFKNSLEVDSMGVRNLVPYPPLVIKGDFHHQPFDDETFDFEFSNVFDHALYPDKFVGEIQRTLKGGGICVIHVAISRRSDKYSANDLFKRTKQAAKQKTSSAKQQQKSIKESKSLVKYVKVDYIDCKLLGFPIACSKILDRC